MAVTNKDTIKNYNRIISISFLNRDPKTYVMGDEIEELRISCPANGRKPNIQITGLFTCDDFVPTFNIKIKNLYMDLTKYQYPYIKVTAGYFDNTKEFYGQILYMYTETPGPESTTVIQCNGFCSVKWMNENIVLNGLKKGFKVEDAISQISSAVSMPYQISDAAKEIVATDDFPFEGKPADAISQLKKHFKESLVIKLQDRQTIDVKIKDEKKKETKHIYFLTTPPTLIGTDSNINSATIMTLWNPQINVGDTVDFNANFYTTTSANLSGEKGKLTMNVTTINFSFSTVSGGNEMTLIGQVLK